MNWAILLTFSGIMYFISPRLKPGNRLAQFFSGKEENGSEIGLKTLTSSLLISWIFAKSIYNSASLGASFSMVGGIAYATYWLSFIVAGFTIYRLKTAGFNSIHEFLNTKFGKGATWLFSFILVFRLWNEIWSNTMVVGQFFGPNGSGSFIAATWVTTALVLLYSLKSGLRSSILTDVIQMTLTTFLVLLLLGFILPKTDLPMALSNTHWSLSGGVDLILVAFIQIWSYPFHDPVMTDRGFITDKKKMLKGFILSGILGFIFIFIFSFIGIYFKTAGLEGNVIIETAKSFGLPLVIIMNVIMLSSASSTIDSTFTSIGKLVSIDLFSKIKMDKILLARISMITLAILGNIMIHAGPSILSATTVSGTMVIGLAPVFIFSSWKRAGKASYYGSVLVGIIFGFMLATKSISGSVGAGKYGVLLYTNILGTIISFGLFILLAYLVPRRER
ncbi:hypothetical protein [Halobacteriovorax sp. JY17]|uniref:hypothetical protein n=1 Tax=Halobacteriovorax sp. JY17 TaxID=2014617 RepID=UPI000C4FEC0F|nr:hypothetical protein [Halobacteriovorax sp. JY17]PIK15749.1 MAG: sodium:solute symporter [Halobacteriovorax sp. JY17]